MEVGNAKTEEHHALDFPRISLADVGSERRLQTIAMDLIASEFSSRVMPFFISITCLARGCARSLTKLFIDAFSDNLNDESPTWYQNVVSCVFGLLSFL